MESITGITMTHKETLVDGDGYLLFERLIPESLIDDFSGRLSELYPVRASSHDHKYAERDDIKNLKDISVWWSQLVLDWPEVIAIDNIVGNIAKPLLNNGVAYTSDTVFIEPHSKWINPHVDTPYRFKKWNFDKELLGIQSIIALTDMDKDTASTGLYPESQKRDWYIDMCYNGYYDSVFKKNMIQPNMPKGSVVMYNCRLLHSSMPNPKDISRPALLLNYVDGDIIEELNVIDNVWKSNGKSHND